MRAALPWGIGLFGLGMVVMHLLVPVGQPAADPADLARLALDPASVEAALQNGLPQNLALPLITHQFLHAGWIHLTMNMIMLLSTGAVTEQLMGRGGHALSGGVRVIALMLLSGIAGAVAFVALNQHSAVLMMGASGALSGLYGAFLVGALRRARFSGQMWQAVAWVSGVFIGLNVILAAVARVTGLIPIAWENHLAGFVAGCLLQPLLAPPPRHQPKAD